MEATLKARGEKPNVIQNAGDDEGPAADPSVDATIKSNQADVADIQEEGAKAVVPDQLPAVAEEAATAAASPATDQPFILYKRRWYQLLLFSLIQLMNQVAWISLAPVASQISLYYDQTLTVVNTISLVYQGIFIIFTFPSNYIIDMQGCRNATLLGISLTFVGAMIKCLINYGFWICILGQVLCAIGQPFLVNQPAKFANVWFGAGERITALTIAVAAQALGAAVGFTIPLIFVSNDDTQAEFEVHIVEALALQAGITGVLTLLALLFFNNKPATPPSAAAEEVLAKPDEFKSSILTLLKDKQMLLLMMAFGQVLGIFNTLGTIIGQISNDCGYTIEEGSNFGALFVVGGILGCIPFTMWIDKKKAYKAAVLTMCLGGTTFCVLEFFFFTSRSVGLIYAIVFFQGGVSLPILAVAIDFGVELTFPIGESFSTGLLMDAGMAFGIIYTVVCSQILDNYVGDTLGSRICFLILAIVGLTGSVFCCTITQDLKRANHEKEVEKEKCNIKDDLKDAVKQ